ncbi:hypothetical protein [Litorihabitans aurantiacus]|uniref:AAA family ATPase n=1 Tax=Litorihabitans aurantiacus TaxID=1930061 RepID=A0AA38CTS1_9MICO|nr:hypothetical protein GCM10025875_15770 [Litorihabitans aurantiacus]
MIAFGATPTQIRTHLTYIRPESSPYAFTEAPAWKNLLARTFTVVVLDGVTDALGQFGAGTKENDDIATWHRAVPRLLATRTRAAVVLIDHVVKNGDTRGRFALGGQAKMAAIDGASYVVEVTEPIGKGLRGTVTLRIAKDRPGSIRPHCGTWRPTDRTQEATRITIDSTTDDGLIRFTAEPPATNVGDSPDGDGRPWKPTGIMEKLSRLLEASREPVSQNKLLTMYQADGGRGRKQNTLDAINLLVDGGHVTESTGPNRSRLLRSSSVYRQRTDPEADGYEPPLHGLITPSEEPTTQVVPGGSQVVPGTTSRVVPTGAPPVGAPEPPNASGTAPVVPDREPPRQRLQMDYRTGQMFDIATGELVDT